MCFWGSGTLAIYLYGFICILYAAPPYSACISAICLLPSGKNWLGSVCSVQCLATKHNAKFTEDWWNLRSNFNPFVGQSSRNFQTMYKTLRPFQRFCLITFCLVFAVTSRNRRKTEVLFAPHFWERRPNFSRGDCCRDLLSTVWKSLVELRLQISVCEAWQWKIFIHQANMV